MRMELRNIVYSHSEYFDVLEIFLEQQELYGINTENFIIFSDKQYKNYECIIYNSLLSYPDRMIYCLEKINYEIILYQHEDMFLYDFPDTIKIKQYLNFLNESSYSFLRLCRTGACNLNQIEKFNSLFEIQKECSDFFAVQPTIWKTKDLIKFLSNAGQISIWELESNSSKISKYVDITGLIHFDNENQRGGHFNSKIWPYVATAIVKGKWNFIEYNQELNKIDKIKINFRQKLITI